jgi:enterochelin esterase-like enzyme
MQADTQSQTKKLEEKLNEWIDIDHGSFPGISYKIYPTNSRGKNTKGSYLIYLPPSYQKEVNRKYPVLYWFHGGNGTAREGVWAIQNYDRAIKNGNMPELIIVSPQALPVGRYLNSRDGKQPIEDVIIKDLIPYIDNTYRIIKDKENRCIEGMSMGGYGALRFGFKFPDLFGFVSAIAPSILRNLSDEPQEVGVSFGNSQDYFEEVGPWHLAEINSEMFIQNKNNLRLFIGKNDNRLLKPLRKYHRFLLDLKISHVYKEIPEAGHIYSEVATNSGNDFFSFWKAV